MLIMVICNQADVLFHSRGDAKADNAHFDVKTTK